MHVNGLLHSWLCVYVLAYPMYAYHINLHSDSIAGVNFPASCACRNLLRVSYKSLRFSSYVLVAIQLQWN